MKHFKIDGRNLVYNEVNLEESTTSSEKHFALDAGTTVVRSFGRKFGFFVTNPDDQVLELATTDEADLQAWMTGIQAAIEDPPAATTAATAQEAAAT